jgi:epoxyqueuosine reductase QueG
MKKGALARLDRFLQNLEVDKVGVVSLEDHKDTPLWRDAGKLLPNAKAVIVLALEVFPEVVKYLSSKRLVGEMALRDLYGRNMEVVNGRLDWEAYRTVKKLHDEGFSGLSLTAGGAPYESRFVEGPISYVQAAQAAGLGVIGWHSMLITPEYGTRVRLALVLTDAPLSSRTGAVGESPCPACGGACVKICPAKAIARPRKGEQWNMNKYACSTYLAATASCAECLRVCPAGKKP